MRSIAFAMGLLLALAACGNGEPSNGIAATPPPRVVEATRIEAPEGVRAWAVRYRSQTVADEPTEVTGWVAIPDARPPMPILSWAHPTVGLGDECAPSQAGGRTPFHFADELAAGWVVIATDYEGLGGPGLHPYLVGEAEARSIFDLARAAREIDSDVGERIVLWGFSQGGHASLSAAALAEELALEFEVVGTIAVAPAVDLIGWPPEAIGTIEQGYIVAIVVGFAAAYGLDRGEILTDRALGLMEEVETACKDPTFYSVSQLAGSEVFRQDPSEVAPWADLLRLNSPELMPIGEPVLLVLGDEDRLWDIELLPLILDRMCAAGTPVATSIHVGEDHFSVSGAARGAILTFAEERRRGEPFESDC